MVKRKAFAASVSLLLLIGLAGSTMAVWAQIGSKTVNEDSAANVSKPAHPFGEKEAAVAQEVKALVANEATSLGMGVGWIHVVSRHDRNKDRVGILPNGQPIPMDYIDDTWYQVNDENSVIAAVAILRTLDGQPWQISTLRDGVRRNLTLGEKSSGAGSPALKLDFGFSADVARASSEGSTISRQEEDVAGRSTLIYSIQDSPVGPTQVEGYEKSIVNGERRAGFDSKTGQMLFLERALVMADGEHRIAERVDILTIERVYAPPVEVLDLLNKEVTP